MQFCRILSHWLVPMAAFWSLPVAAEAQDSPPLEAYGAMPTIEDVAISPSGDLLAMAAQTEGGRRIVVLDPQLDGMQVIDAQDVKFRGLRFIGDEALLVHQTQTEELRGFTMGQYELRYATVVTLGDDAETRPVFNGERQLATAVFGNHGIRQVEGGWRGYFGAVEYDRNSRGDYVFNRGTPVLVEVDFSDLSNQRISRGAEDGDQRDWVIGPRGGVAARFDISRNSGRWTIRNGSGDRLAEGRTEDGNAGLVGLGYDGTTIIYFSEDSHTGLTDWFEVPLAGGMPQPFLDGVDVRRLYRDPANGQLLGYLAGRGSDGPVFRDPTLQQRVDMVWTTFADYEISLQGWTRAMDKVIVHISGNGDSGTWLLVDVLNRSAQAIGFDRPDIPPALVGTTSLVHYTASDGLQLDGVLTLPPGVENAANLPLIVLPHGGPHSHDGLGFDWWAQAFASRGYVVFQPNFRGSSGRGEEFMLAGHGEWGGKMQSDISDGVSQLAAAGIVDAERACIVGASYGGYAALAGVTLQQGLYRCAVSVNGVSDLASMYREELRESGRSRLIRASLQEEWGPRASWSDISPRRQAARADAPVLLVHGRDDTVVLFEQSRLMADALDDHGKPYRLVELDGEDHWLSLPETRHQMLQSVMQFVLEHNPPD